MSAALLFAKQKAVQRILSKRPGDDGFSLIELVVVVAVLAILAAIAIPAFNGLQDDARRSGAKANLAMIAKECAYSAARATNGVGTHTRLTDGNGVAYDDTLGNTDDCFSGTGNARSATASAVVTTDNGGTTTTYSINLDDGSKPSANW